ncbi:MAG: hypothetical protein ACRD50_05050 [Candidatus Acidiferrales bacterium]
MPLFIATALILFTSACHKGQRTDTTQLDNIGMSFSAIEELRKLDITNVEVPDLTKAKQAGMTDDGCIAIVKIYHDRNRPFDAGDAVAGLAQAGVKESTVLELARLDQMNFWGEAQAMRLARLSDEIILELARHRAAGKPELSGASLAELKNEGFSEALLLELARRGVPDDQKSTLITFRRRGWNDRQILEHFPAS